MSSALDTTLRDETAYLEMVQDRNNKILQLQKELEEQKEKFERVQKQVCGFFFKPLKKSSLLKHTDLAATKVISNIKIGS